MPDERLSLLGLVFGVAFSQRNSIVLRCGDRCRWCGHPLAWVDEVGWVDMAPGGAHDMCEADPDGNHQPRPNDRALRATEPR